MTKETSMTQAIKVMPQIDSSRRNMPKPVSSLQKLLEDDPKDEDALELLGMASFFQQNLEPARDCFERLTQLNPSHTKAWVNLGAILNRMGDHGKRRKCCVEPCRSDRKCAEAYYNMGIAQRAMQTNTMAISAYKEALKLAPEMIDAHINLGNIYTGHEEHWPGIAMFSDCIATSIRNRLKPERVWTRRNRCRKSPEKRRRHSVDW